MWGTTLYKFWKVSAKTVKILLKWSEVTSLDRRLSIIQFARVLTIYVNFMEISSFLPPELTWLTCSANSPGKSSVWPSPAPPCPRRTRSTWPGWGGSRCRWWWSRPARCSACRRWSRHCQTTTLCWSKGKGSLRREVPALHKAVDESSVLVGRQWRSLSERRWWWTLPAGQKWNIMRRTELEDSWPGPGQH